jgi:hypothetical protein
VPRRAARDPLTDLSPDARIAAQKARRWLTGVLWATLFGYGPAWIVSRFSSFASPIFAIAFTAQVVCFVLWWHYMNVMDRSLDKLVVAQGVSLDMPTGGGWTGFAKRHPILFGLALSAVLLGGIVWFAFSR